MDVWEQFAGLPGEGRNVVEVVGCGDSLDLEVHEPAEEAEFGAVEEVPRCGVNACTTFVETDEFGCNVVSDGVHIHDFHTTMLHLLGIDHERLTYKLPGRRYRLTDVYGNLVKGLLA